MEPMESIVARELGPEGIGRMVAAFYQRMRDDDLVGPMYPEDDWEGSEERLRDFLKFRLLGDPIYQLKRGHPRLRMRHMPFKIGEAERDRWLEIMASAMEDSGVSEAGREALMPFFGQVAEAMRNH